MTGDKRPTDANQASPKQQANNDLPSPEASQQNYHLLTAIVQQLPVAIAVLEGPDYRIKLANRSLYEIWQLPENDKTGEPVFDAFPSIAHVGLEELLAQVRRTGEPIQRNEQPFDMVRKGNTEKVYISFTYSPLHNPMGEPDVLVVAHDVTEEVLAKRKTIESEARFQSMAEESGVLIAVGDTTSNATYFSRAWVELTGCPMQKLLGFGWVDLVHPDDRDRYVKTYLSAFDKREPFSGEFRLLSKEGNYHWLLATGRARFEPDGAFLGYISSCVDFTPTQQAQKALQLSETKLRSIIDTAPVAIGLLIGPDHVLENPNQTFIDILGKGPSINGKPLREVMPELVTENQPFLQILDEVYATGKPFYTDESPIDIVRQGTLNRGYYKFSYIPLFDEQGAVYAILDIATDITEQVRARIQLQETQDSLRSAMALADIGTWEFDVRSGLVTYSEGIKKLLEFTEDSMEASSFNDAIYAPDQLVMEAAMASAFDPASGGLLDEEYTVITQQTGRHRFVRAQARTYFDDYGQAYKMVGTMRDVTEERQIQLTLEQLVHRRTEELEASNQELAVTNEELAANNEELTAAGEEVAESNRQLEEAVLNLVRSNENLEQFAYIASHDLQEPLRKIQQFGDLLKQGFEDSSQKELDYLNRMQVAASRMSLLIKDLLTFSRISTKQANSSPVALSRVLDDVQDTLSVAIEESGARIEREVMPIVQGDKGQLGQLFQNLLSNAIKFSRQDQSGNRVPPVVTIQASQIRAEELPAGLKPARYASTYHQISVKDNGIGFDDKYADRIFQVFQRLHGRNEFAGTGVGLAICQKVAANHGGAITVTSQPGEGATFSVYLPE